MPKHVFVNLPFAGDKAACMVTDDGQMWDVFQMSGMPPAHG